MINILNLFHPISNDKPSFTIAGITFEVCPKDKIHTDYFNDYCKYVAEGNYTNAYEKCMNSRYKKDISIDDFTSAHEKRKETMGILLEKKLTFKTNSYNIFSGLREYEFTYELKYTNTTNHEIIRLNDQDGIFLIEGTYTSSSSDTLRFMVW